MKKSVFLAAFMLIVAMALAGCGKQVSPPTGLTAEGARLRVTLSWAAGSAQGLTGYIVERSVEGAPFVELVTVGAGTTEYSDTEVVDGELYRYRVRAVADTKKSDPSKTVVSMHGTRITNQADNFATAAEDSPYVIEGSVSFAGSLTVAEGTKLYVLPGATLTFTDAWVTYFQAFGGLLQIRGTASAPVHVSSTGGGVYFYFGSAADGCLVEYAEFTNMGGLAGGSDCMVFNSSAPTVRYSRFKPKNESAILCIYGSSDDSSNVVLEHCLFENLVLYFETCIPAGLRIDSCIFTGGTPTIQFNNFSSGAPGPASGQLVNNVFQLCGTASSDYQTADLSFRGTAPTGTIPLGGNYFYRGTAVDTPITGSGQFYFYPESAAASYSLSGILAARPADAGPGWGDLPF